MILSNSFLSVIFKMGLITLSTEYLAIIQLLSVTILNSWQEEAREKRDEMDKSNIILKNTLDTFLCKL
jgi:hypothetical protein